MCSWKFEQPGGAWNTGNKANPTKELHRLLPVILGKFLNLFLSLGFLILKRPHLIELGRITAVFSTPLTSRRILSKILFFFWGGGGGIICMAMGILFSLSLFIFQSKWRNTFSIKMGKKAFYFNDKVHEQCAHIHTHQCFEIWNHKAVLWKLRQK